MTHDTHATGSSRQSGRRHPRPDLGRPSLFADFDQASVEDVDPQRIRLLSTLESQRGVRRRPRARRLPTGRNHPWLTRALMAAMGLGMLVMLLSFIQLLRRPPPDLRTPQSMATATALAHPAQLSASASAAAPEAAEIIDMSPPAGGGAPSPAMALSPASPTTPPAAPLAAGVDRHAASPNTTAATTATTATTTEAVTKPIAAPERVSRTVKPGGTQRPAAQRDTGASRDDVALVEAMLAHAGPRQAPPPPTVALRQCGTDRSPQTAVCRARICVQHPSLPACHTP